MVAGPLVAAQYYFSFHRAEAALLAVGLVGSFLLTAPFAWRALFPSGRELSFKPLRLLAYGVLGVLPIAVGRTHSQTAIAPACSVSSSRTSVTSVMPRTVRRRRAIA